MLRDELLRSKNDEIAYVFFLSFFRVFRVEHEERILANFFPTELVCRAESASSAHCI